MIYHEARVRRFGCFAEYFGQVHLRWTVSVFALADYGVFAGAGCEASGVMHTVAVTLERSGSPIPPTLGIPEWVRPDPMRLATRHWSKQET